MSILSCSNSLNKYQFYTSVHNVPKKVWEELGCANNLYLRVAYLEALEKCNTTIKFSYLLVLDEHGSPVAFTTIQLIEFYLDSLQSNTQSVVEWLKCMGRKFRLISPEKPIKILASGNAFVSGECGIFIKHNQNKKQIIKDISKALVKQAKTKYKDAIDVFMLKDFLTESLYITDELKALRFNSFKVEPNMVLHVKDNWNSFEDYLAAMKTKFRVKAKKAIKQSSSLQIKDISLEMLKNLLPEMTNLYENVLGKSNFNLGNFNLESYTYLKQNLKDAYVLKGYWLEEKLVGFMSGILNQNTLDAHFVGIDYQFNRSHAIYQRMLYDYVFIGIQQKVSCINFGRTASEIKSSIGAVPQDLTIYLRHKHTIPNKILSLFLHKIQPTAFKQKLPFKEFRVVEKIK